MTQIPVSDTSFDRTDGVTLLGVKGGPAIRPGSPMPTSHLLDLDGQSVVVDAGLGVSRGLTDAGFDLRRLSHVVITHLHSDHYLELGPLLHTAWTAGLNRTVTLYGPNGLADYWTQFCGSMAFDIDLRIRDEGRPDLRRMVDIVTLDPAHPISIGPLEMSVMINDHPPIVESYALRFQGASACVVFSGDTAPISAMVDFAREADVLVHEAMLLAGVDALCARVGNGDDRLRKHLLASHAPAAEVAKIAARAGVKVLALNHLIPSDDAEFGPKDWLSEVSPHFKGRVHIGQDGLFVPL